MKRVQMNKKGITLMSLIIYITLMFVILALIMRVTTYFTKNMNESADTSFETEFEKFNMYMLQETQKVPNGVYKFSENRILFIDGNTIEYRKEENDETGKIFFNEIIICENVDDCIFSKIDYEEKRKTKIGVNIEINGVRKNNIEYITSIVRLPLEYQEVEYIECTGTQYIDTKYKANTNSHVIITFSYTEETGERWSNGILFRKC